MGNRIINWLCFAILLALMALAIALFFIRNKYPEQTLGQRLIIRPQKSSQKIIADSYLIQIHPSHINHLDEILGPLSLELKMPLLNWLLVGKIGENQGAIIQLLSDEASISRLTLNSLLQHPKVLDAQHNFVLEEMDFLEEETLSEEWQLQGRTNENPSAINLLRAWEITKGSKDLSVAIVDQFLHDQRFIFAESFPGCEKRITFLNPFPHLAPIKKTKEIPHGELMLQALGACNGVLPNSAGIDWQAQMLAVERPYVGEAETFVAAVLASGIDVCKESILPCKEGVSFPLPAKKPDVLLMPFGNDAPDVLQFSADMISFINNRGIIVVTAAGNDRANADNIFPAGIPQIINVGALNRTGNLASFSNWGPVVDLLAPGDDIEMIFPNGPKKVSGTSIASAYVAGSILLMKSVNKNLHRRQVEYILKNGSRPVPCEDYCPNNRLNIDEECARICCNDGPSACGRLLLDTHQVVRDVLEKKPLPPLLTLEKTYLLYLRDQLTGPDVVVSNVGEQNADIIATVFDNNIEVIPSQFSLRQGAKKILKVHLKKEPYRRQTFKIELRVKLNDVIVDSAPFYVEYIPKK